MQLNHRSRSTQSGFTLIELMVTVTLLAILLGLAAPAFGTWINNTRVRTTADTLQNGLRLAQAEAVRRNRTVAFFLTNSEPALASTLATNGKNWGIRSLTLTGTNDEFVRGGALSDVAAGVTITSAANLLCFNGVGQQTSTPSPCAATAARFTIARAGADRSLRVDVSINGRVRMCDPAKTLSATNPDGCEA